MSDEAIKKKAVEMHSSLKGKIEVKSKIELESREQLNWAYTPGVAQPCIEISKDKEKVYEYTAKSNIVAVLTNGTAVLGLGNIGAEASIPVMEGKAILFKRFGKVDAFPIAVQSQDPKKVIETVKEISPVFGGINLEDIKAPECFEIEETLKQELDIPVFHDDQHGTAIVVLAGLINAVKFCGKKIEDLSVLINGAGAAGVAISEILITRGVKDIVMLDSKGALYFCRDDIQLNKIKKGVAKKTNIVCKGKQGLEKDPEECKRCMQGNLCESIKGRDVFIGVSVANVLTKEMVKTMKKDPIIFAMANPVPEISYKDAKEAGAKVVGTGRSDMPNQINNVYAFPGIFRGALDARASTINEEMKLAAAEAIANNVKDISEENIMPDLFDEKLHNEVAEAVKKAAIESSVVKKDGDRKT